MVKKVLADLPGTLPFGALIAHQPAHTQKLFDCLSFPEVLCTRVPAASKASPPGLLRVIYTSFKIQLQSHLSGSPLAELDTPFSVICFLEHLSQCCS